VTILFTALTVLGVIEVITLIVVSVVLGRSERESDREVVSFRLMSQAAIVLAAGVAGLAMTLGGAGVFGFAIVAVVIWAVLMAVIWKAVLPYTRERWPIRPR
jgi:O-antigen/teichoic acid export membrane protein